ncbi:MAG: hypothetical protein U5Q44_10320 [Dehalococcoidia bacterium]|nr:hypothetical protein [Dehalococcoidia bacterium]
MTMTTPELRVLLMSAEFTNSGTGFHRVNFRVSRGRGKPMQDVAVLVSVDAYRKLATQLARARIPLPKPRAAAASVARWEVTMRYEDHGSVPSTLTITDQQPRRARRRAPSTSAASPSPADDGILPCPVRKTGAPVA